VCQLSSVTERGRLYGWLDAEDESSLPASAAADATAADATGGLLSESRLSQTVGHVSLHVAARLRADAHLGEAYDTYRYALAIFLDHLPPGRSALGLTLFRRETKVSNFSRRRKVSSESWGPFTCVYVLLCDGKCKRSYGPSRPVDSPLYI